MEHERCVEIAVLIKMVQLYVTLLTMFTDDFDVLVGHRNDNILAFMNHMIVINIVIFKAIAF
jgi:hypothetical protein